VALWWALTRPHVEVDAVLATWGNVGRAGALANVARVLTATGGTGVSVALGAAGPVGPSPFGGRAGRVHGDDGLGGHAGRWPTGGVEPVAEPAGELLARLTAAHPGELDLVTIGPLSTLAGALASDPALAGRVRSLTVMGGSVATGGHALPLVEANVGLDPAAAAAVVVGGWRSPPLLVGLDVTLRTLLAAEDLALADEARTAAARFVAGPLRAYARSYAGSGQVPPGTSPCHDLLAVLAALDTGVITEAPTVPLAVDTGGSAAWGATVADRRPVPEDVLPGFAPWRVALQADRDRFRAAFRALVTAPPSS
jgi:purine nucleosidase